MPGAQGDLMSRLTNDMDAISQVLTNHATQLFTGILTLAGILVIIFILNPLLALGSMIAFPIDDRPRRYGRKKNAECIPELPGAAGGAQCRPRRDLQRTTGGACLRPGRKRPGPV